MPQPKTSETSQSSRRRRAPNAGPSHQAWFPDGSARTLADIQYQTLHRRIVAMELPPGSPISETDLARDAGISRTPIREAILRLAREKLVEVVPKSGTFVARIPLSALPEALIARRALESMTTRVASRTLGRSQELGLLAILESQRELEQQGDRQGFHVADEAFHEEIAIIAGLPGLWHLVQQVKMQSDRLRHLTLPEPGRMSMAIREHAAVAEALGQRDAERACAAMERHLSGLQQHIRTVVEAHPDYFIHDINLDDMVQV